MDQRINEQLNRVYRRNSFAFNDIEYIVHTNQRTYFHLCDGRDIKSTMPLKAVLSCLPTLDFWSIQKGVVVAVRFVKDISDDFLYTMVSGKTFQGRSRNPAEHKRHRRLLMDLPGQNPSHASPLSKQSSLGIQCAIFDRAPIAFTLIEMIFSGSGRGIDFIFRYCNQEMARLEGVSIEDMLNHSLYEVFPGADKKWIVPYADVAINGTNQLVRKYSPVYGREISIQCFQPMPGFCACILVNE